MTTKEYYAEHREEIRRKRIEYYQRTKHLPPKIDKKIKDRLYREKNKQHIKERMSTPYWTAYKRNYQKMYRQRPYVKERHRAACLEYIHSDNGKKRIAEFRSNYVKSGRASERLSKYRKDRRFNIIMLLGGGCNSCGCNDIEVLDIDHINGDGKQDRELYGSNREALFHYLKYPNEMKSKFQLLCKNCHYRKTHKERYG